MLYVGGFGIKDGGHARTPGMQCLDPFLNPCLSHHQVRPTLHYLVDRSLSLVVVAGAMKKACFIHEAEMDGQFVKKNKL